MKRIAASVGCAALIGGELGRIVYFNARVRKRIPC